MAVKTEDIRATELGERISQRMNELNLSIRGLSEKIDLTYEHTRRIVRGEAPSDIILRAVCNVLGLDFAEMQKLAVDAKIKKKYGAIPLTIAGKNPELEPIERAWPHLTNQQKQDAITMIQGWAKRNRALQG